jgi:hypothetical protein
VPPARSRSRIGVSALGVLAVALLLAGCGDFDDPAAAQGVTRNDLIAELAAQLSESQLGGSAARTYAATYQLAGGTTGSIVQAKSPPRTAYRYPGGAILVTGAATTRCVRKSCTMTAPPSPVGPVSARMLADAAKTGLASPTTVLGLLNAAVLDTDLTVNQHDTTIAGRHATCVELAGVDDAATSKFSTCITTDGVLGSFAGTLGGREMDVAMTDYADRVAATAFDPPPAATMIDRR